MDNYISTTFFNTKEELGLSLKDTAKIVADLKEKHGDIPEACIMCESINTELRKYVMELQPEQKTFLSPDFGALMGLIICIVEDEDARLIPELGTENILLGTWVEVWKLGEYIKRLKEKGGK